MSDQVENQNVGFLMTRAKFKIIRLLVLDEKSSKQSHSTITVWLPYGVGMFESAGVSVIHVCCVLFYMVEVTSKLKMSSFTH